MRSQRSAPARTPKRPLAVIVMAAGEGKRFRSATPKVLHRVAGRPMLAAVLDAVAPIGAVHTVVVVGRAAEAVQEQAETLSRKPLLFARQADLLGTADAARTGEQALPARFNGDVLIVSGDTPLLTTDTVRALVARHRRSGAAMTLLSATLEDATGYGRILREGGSVAGIVEQTDATPVQRAITEINTGIYAFRRDALRAALALVDRANEQNELYLTDAVAILRDKGEQVEAVSVADPTEILGVNDRSQLASVEQIVRARTNERLMLSGVTIVDPATTTIDATVKIGRDTVIFPMTLLRGQTVIGAGCTIGPSTQIDDSRIDNGARVLFSVLDNARVGPEASVGPFAYLRPGARLAKGAKVGTFVEVKGSTIGEGSKVPHLSYVGDAQIGRDVNVGAATVTVNYDAETKIKAKTVIGDGAKIGSDTMLIAPVKIGRRAVTGAGSVVTKDVPAETVVVGNPAKKLRKRKGEKSS